MRTLATIFFTVSLSMATVLAENTEDNIERVIEKTSSAGDDNIPVSNKAKERLKRTLEKSETTPSQQEKSASSQLMSTDCQNWQTIDQIENETDGKDVKNLFFKSDERITVMNLPDQGILTIEKEKATYFRIVKNAVVGFYGQRGFIYRPLKQGTVERDIAGLMQVMLLMAVESGDHWQIATDDKGKPKLALPLLFQKSQDPSLKGIVMAICNIDQPCYLVKRTDDKRPQQVELKKDLKETKILRDMGLLSTPRIQALEETCQHLTSRWYQRGVQDSLAFVEKACRRQGLSNLVNFEKINTACRDVVSHLLPKLRRLQ